MSRDPRRMKTDMTTRPTLASRQRAVRLDAALARYLDQGGKVTRLPPGPPSREQREAVPMAWNKTPGVVGQ